MGRPPIPVGAYGKIYTKQIGPKTWRAEAYYRDHDGETRRMTRTGTSKTAAENRLKEALSKVGDEVRGGEVTSDMRVRTVAELWLQEVREEAAGGRFSANTVRNYSGYVKNWINPAVGSLVIGHELSVRACEKLIKKVRDKKSYDAASSCRSVLSSICQFALRHGALKVNPVRSIDRMRGAEQKEVRAMTKTERADLIAKLRILGQQRQVDSQGRSLGHRGQVWLDLPEIVEAMLSTGVRIGEVVAVQGEDVDPARKTVKFSHHVVRETGHGLIRAKGRKGGEPGITLMVPDWSVPMWRRRKLASGGGPVFSNWGGGLLDPNTLMHRIREAFDECGYDWVTGHVFRKTVALVLKEAGLSIEAIADQLGNTTRVAEKHYAPKLNANPAAAAALDGMF